MSRVNVRLGVQECASASASSCAEAMPKKKGPAGRTGGAEEGERNGASLVRHRGQIKAANANRLLRYRIVTSAVLDYRTGKSTSASLAIPHPHLANDTSQPRSSA